VRSIASLRNRSVGWTISCPNFAAQAKEAKGFEGNAILASNAAWEKGLRKIEGLAGRRYSDLDEYQFGALFAGSRMVANRRSTVERFVRAYQKGTAEFSGALLNRDAAGQRVFDANSLAIAALVARHVYPSETADKAVALVEASTYYVDPQGRLDVADIHQQVAWYKSQGLVDAPVDPKSFIDLSFVQGHTNIPQ
jgi:ABC-type nitrate/sulfonate/bicarbonate transport system substrate-binding protein